MDDDFIDLNDDSDVFRSPEPVSPISNNDEFDYNSYDTPFETHTPKVAEKVDIPNRVLTPVPQEEVDEVEMPMPADPSMNNESQFMAPEDMPPQEHVVKFEESGVKSKYKKKFPIGLIIVILILVGVAAFGISYLMSGNGGNEPGDTTATKTQDTSGTSSSDTTDDTTDDVTKESTSETVTTTEDPYKTYHEVINYPSNYQIGQMIHCGLVKKANGNGYECASEKKDDFLSVDFTYTCKNPGCEYFSVSDDGTNVVLYDGDYFSYNFKLSKRTDLNLPTVMYKSIVPYVHNSEVYGAKVVPYNNQWGMGYYDVTSKLLAAKFGDYPNIESNGLMAKYGFFFAEKEDGSKLGLYSVAQKKLVLKGEVAPLTGKNSLYFVYGDEDKPVYVSADGYITNGLSVFDSNMNLLQFRTGANNYSKINQVYSYTFVDYSNDENNKELDDSLVLGEASRYYVFYKQYDSNSSGDYCSAPVDKVLGFDSHYVVLYKDGVIKVRNIGISNKYVTGFSINLTGDGYKVKLDYKGQNNQVVPNIFLYKLKTCGDYTDAELLSKYLSNGKSSTDPDALQDARKNCNKSIGDTNVSGTYYEYNGVAYQANNKTFKVSELSR